MRTIKFRGKRVDNGEWLDRHQAGGEKSRKAKLNLKHTKSMKEKTYTEAELVSFGNYVLSERRKKHIEEEHLIDVVGDWDIANWQNQE